MSDTSGLRHRLEKFQTTGIESKKSATLRRGTDELGVDVAEAAYCERSDR